MNIHQLKRCRKCGELKTADKFYKNSRALDGLYSYCKDCKDKARKKHYIENIDNEKKRAKQYGKQWYQDNKKQKNEKNKKWRLEHPERAREFVRTSRLRNIEKVKKRVKQYILENKEKIKERYKKWSLANPEKERMRAKQRRDRLRGASGSFSVDEWNTIKKKYGNKCLCCGRKEPEIKLTIDHVVPISIGGNNTIENIQPLCHSCNSRKQAKEIDYR